MGQNVELPNFTQALYDARELAMSRMQAEAEEVKAEGIVGVQLSERNHGWGSHVLEFFALGTALVPYDAPRDIAAPTSSTRAPSAMPIASTSRGPSGSRNVSTIEG